MARTPPTSPLSPTSSANSDSDRHASRSASRSSRQASHAELSASHAEPSGQPRRAAVRAMASRVEPLSKLHRAKRAASSHKQAIRTTSIYSATTTTCLQQQAKYYFSHPLNIPSIAIHLQFYLHDSPPTTLMVCSASRFSPPTIMTVCSTSRFIMAGRSIFLPA